MIDPTQRRRSTVGTTPKRGVLPRGRTVVALCVLTCMLGGFAASVQALVPRANRVIEAVAGANVSGRRVRALRFQLNLRIGNGPPVAVGELVSHPTGLARLELRAPGGLVERHILLGDQHSAARNARLLIRPRAFLPPLFVLQSNSGAVLEAALGTLGVDRRLIGLAPCGENDCYVIGDPKRSVRRLAAVVPEAAVVVEEAVESAAEEAEQGLVTFAQDAALAAEQADEAQEEEDDFGDSQQARAEQFFPTLWVDSEDHNVRAVESRTGVRLTLGPYVKFEHLSVPHWWTITEPGKREVRFEVEGVVEVNAAAAAFSKSWLMAPMIEGPPHEGEAPATEEGGVTSTTLEPLPPTPPVSSAASEEELEALGFDESPGEGYDYPN
ncbi:MAG: hypothetical protein GY733_20080 [bacterium]|nr:hypothetical protein [bacterium]